jgi:hypothetical protein
MKRPIVLTILLAALLLSSGFSYGQDVKENRKVNDFSRINFGVSGDLFIEFGPDFEVTIEGSRSSVDDVITEVSGGRLTIKHENNFRLRMNERVTVYVTMPEIEGLGVSGSGKAEIKDVVKGDDLNLSVSGSGRLVITGMDVENLDCGISGSGTINLDGNGSVGKADISISGSGDYYGEEVEIESLTVGVSGSGKCICNVSESLSASISGSGDVSYSGSPRVNARVSGSGHVRSR